MTKTGVAPLRISFVGGGTDIPSCYEKFGGVTVSCTIDKYVRLKATHNQEIYGHRINWVDADEDPIFHEIMDYCKPMVYGHKIKVSSDINAWQGGLGSSHALSIAFLRTFYPIYTPKETAKIACSIEIDNLKRGVGLQDGYAIALGGCHMLHYFTNGQVTPIKLETPDAKHFLLFNTGIKRDAGEIHSKHQMPRGKDYARMSARMAEDFVDALNWKNYYGMGILLTDSWHQKKHYNPATTTPEIEKLMKVAKLEGAWGGKVLGAGAGGHLVFTAPEDKQPTIIEALEGLGAKHIEFEFEGG